MGTVDDDLLPPLPKGYTSVKSDGGIPPLPKGFSPIAPTPAHKLGNIPDINTFSQPSNIPYTPQYADAHQQAIQTAKEQKAVAQPREKPQKEERGILDQVGQALYLPAFNQGFNELVTKPLAGANDFVDRTIDKVYTGITGQQTPDWLRKGSGLDNIVKYYDDAYQGRDKPKNIVSDITEGAVGTIPLMASMFTGEGEASLAAKAPQFISKATKILGITGAANAYKDATDNGEDYGTSLKEAAKGEIKGNVQGLTIDAQMLVGNAFGKRVGNILAEKGLKFGGKAGDAILHAIATGTVFGGTSAGSDLLQGKDIDTHEAMKQFGMGLMFEIPAVAKGMNEHLEGKRINDNAAKLATASTAISNMNAESTLRTLMNTPSDKLAEINDNVKQGHDELYANSIEQGAKAYEAEDLGAKNNHYANQMLLKTQADVKLIADKVADPEQRSQLVESITQSDELPPEQKQDLLDKIAVLTPKDELPKQAEPIVENGVPEVPQEIPAEKVNEEPTNNNLKTQENEKSGEQSRQESGQETGSKEEALPAEEKVSEAGEADAEPVIKVNEILDKPVTYHGEPAMITQDGQTLVAKIKDSNREYELGNADEVGDKSIKELGIEHQGSVVGTNEKGDLTVRDKEYQNNYSDPLSAINRDKEGNIVSVNLETPDGKKRTFKGDIAEDLAYQIHLKELNKDNVTKEQFEQFAGSDEPTKSAIVSAENENTAEKGTVENNAEVSRNPIRKPIVKEPKGGVNEPTKNNEAVPAADSGNTKKEAKGRPESKVSEVPKETGKVASLSDAEAKRKLELRKKFSGQFNDITRIPTLLANKEFREYAGLVLKETAGDFKQFSKELIDHVGEKIREHLPKLFKDLGGDEKQISEHEDQGGEVKKTILTKRAYEGTIADDVKKYLEEKGLTRKSFSQEERSKQATDFINKFGEEASFEAVKAGDIEGGMAASILAQLQIKNSRAMGEFPEGSDERDELAKKQADYIALMEKKGYLGGEFNGQLAHEYENAELDYANVKKQVEKLTGKKLTPEQEQKVKKLTSDNETLKAKLKEAEAKLIEETDKALSEDTVKPKTAYAKKALDAVVKVRAKIRANSYSDTTGMVALVDTALATIEAGIRTGMTVTKAIEKGIDHIKSELKKRGIDWEKEDEFRKDVTDAFAVEGVSDRKNSIDLADLQEHFLNKTDNKFSSDEARDIWGYMKKQYIENGTSFKDAISKTANDLGLSWRQISEAITTPKNKRISDEMWKRQADLTRNRTGIKNWIGDQNKTLVGKALQKISGLFRGVAVFGHGGIFVGTHAGMTVFNPSMWNKTIPAFLRGWKFAYGNEANYQRAIEELKNSPNYIIAQRAGLKNNPERVNTEEYQKSQKYLGKLALAGEKGFNAIKVLRQDLFDYHFSRLSPAERDDPSVAKSIAHIVNLATGATTIKIPAWVNEASFAGGMEAARWEKLTASPVKATEVALNAIFNPSKATVADRVFAKVWSRRVGEQLATFSAALLANAAIQNTLNPKNPVNYTNPNKPDFLKFKFGDVTIDPTSGMRSVAMFMYTLAKIPFESKKELHGEKRIKVLGKDVAGYARGKLAPLYSTGADFFTSQDYNGNVMPYSKDKPSGYAHKLTWGEYAWNKAPLPVAEAANVAYKSALEHGAHRMTLNHVLDGILSGVISGTTGFRVGEYDANSPKNKTKHSGN